MGTKPNKRIAVILLILNVLTGIPELLIGLRNPIMTKVVFGIVYYIMRDFLERENEGKWIRKKEIITMVMLIPICIVGLGVMNYTRSDEGVEDMSVSEIAIDFFYKQGTSFDTVCQGLLVEDKLKTPEVMNYTFGEVIDYVVHNPISQKIFNTDELDSSNSIEMATKSNSMSHHLSYIVMGDEYLEGHGRGSSYILEAVIDFGVIGVIIINIILGGFCALIYKVMRSDCLWGAGAALICIMNIYMIPRASFSSCIVFLFTPQFWMSVIIIVSVMLIAMQIKEKGIRGN